MTYKLTWMPDVLRAAGLTVKEVPGWQTRGHGDVGSVVGVLCHHTAGAGPSAGTMPSLNTVTRGRPGLSGPLCNLALGRDGVWYVVAAGRAYHAGVGNYRGLTAGNSQLIGIEAENTGYLHGPRAEFPWPKVQMDSYARGCAALLDHLKQPVIMCAAHKEYAPTRKVDPDFDMTAFRASVADQMAKPTGSFAGHLARAKARFAKPGPQDVQDGCKGGTDGVGASRSPLHAPSTSVPAVPLDPAFSDAGQKHRND